MKTYNIRRCEEALRVAREQAYCAVRRARKMTTILLPENPTERDALAAVEDAKDAEAAFNYLVKALREENYALGCLENVRDWELASLALESAEAPQQAPESAEAPQQVRDG